MTATKQFTYSGDPASSTKDEVRFLVGDTIEAQPLFDDREVAFVISQNPDVRIAGAELLEAKAREFARQADIRIGDISKAFGKVADSMFKAADSLRDDANKRALPFFGGLSKTGKRTLAQDSDAVQPQFALEQADNPLALQLNRDVGSLYSLVGPYGW